jgi:hypothetical protein
VRAGLGAFELALRMEGAESVDDLMAAQLTDYQLGPAGRRRPPPWRTSVPSPAPSMESLLKWGRVQARWA